eukprot:ANDGO_04586.mRNA.1 Hypoxanthine phosphoribosyltransferase
MAMEEEEERKSHRHANWRLETDEYLSSRWAHLSESQRPTRLAKVLDATEIAECVCTVARSIEAQVASTGKHGVFLVGVLTGCVFFMADLARELRVPHRIGVIKASSYGNEQTNAGASVTIDCLFSEADLHPNTDLFVLVDELLESGRTLEHVSRALRTRFGPHRLPEVHLCALFKKHRPDRSVILDFGGFDVPDLWLVGYGLDNSQGCRGWKHIYAVPKAPGIPDSPDDRIYFS